MGRNYTKGIIGGIIGGLIASIPWILLDVYGNIICSYFAFFIGIGVLKGYQYRGLTDRKLPKIVMIISLFIITLVTLIITPLIQLNQGTSYVNINSLITLYSFEPFLSVIIKNYVIAIIFTLLGLKGVINEINS